MFDVEIEFLYPLARLSAGEGGHTCARQFG